MAKKEADKLDIEDIKDPLDETDPKELLADVDLEEAVAEEPEVVPEVEAPAEALQEEPSKEDPDELEKSVPSEVEGAVEEKKAEPAEESGKKPKKEKPQKTKKPFPWKTVGIVVITFLVTVALILGGYFLYEKYYKKSDEVSVQPATTSNVNVAITKPAATQKTVYTTADPTLNLRKDPSTSGQVLATIPYGTQLTVVATQGAWYQVTYNSLTGWIDSTYTTANNPLLYQNADYRFQITFPAGWSGYKFFTIKADSTDTASWYVALPTTQAGYSETGIDKGYASMFALTVYTPDQWKTVQASEGPKPNLAVQNSDYVIAYSLPNGTPPTDLTTQAAQTKDVTATIKFY